MPGPEVGLGDPETKPEGPCPQGAYTLHLQSCICKVMMPTPFCSQEVSFLTQSQGLAQVLDSISDY